MTQKKLKLPMNRKEFEDFLPERSLASLKVDGEDICFAHTPGGYYAFENSCPHYSVPLDTGKLNHLNQVVCSLHAYRFDLDHGWEADGKDYCLKKYQIEFENDDVFVVMN